MAKRPTRPGPTFEDPNMKQKIEQVLLIMIASIHLFMIFGLNQVIAAILFAFISLALAALLETKD